MSKVVLYSGLKARLLAVTGVNYVGLWNNQPKHEKEEHPLILPAVYIEFLPSNYQDFLQGVQKYDMVVRLHICFTTLKDVDTDIWTLQRDIAIAMRYAQYSYFNKLSLVSKEQNFDHDNVQDYTQDYKTSGKDYVSDKRPAIDVNITIEENVELVDSLTDSDIDDNEEPDTSELILYNGIKTDLETLGVYVELWNNQIEKQQHPHKFPAVYVQFLPSENQDFLDAAQRLDFTIRLHICFEAYTDETDDTYTDSDILTLVESVFTKMHYKQYGIYTKLKRINEEQDFDHDQVQVYIQDYRTSGKEFQPNGLIPVTLTFEENIELTFQIGVLETEYGPDILQENGDNILL